MFLKKIELKGFKSFADRTCIDFGQGITCIVGPNGSGKSNVTDAFRWVLGEQRFKTLRGSQMLDVIFNGTTKRKALGFAEVAITFDNSTGMLPTEYTEVTVVRRLYRSGESEYTINDNKCRLKDIKELFMDTGVGVEGYSIIGQGRIESILSTNKDERRLILEEAAGIVKFRTRKEEAQRKLDRTGQNLERIEDIVKELEQRVGPLKEQSEKATAYQTLSTSLRGLEINLFIHEVEEVNGALQIVVDDLEAREKINHASKHELEGHLDTVNTLEAELEARSQEANGLNQEQQQVMTNITTLSHEIDLIFERRTLIEGNIEKLRAQQSEEGQEQEILTSQLAAQNALLVEKRAQYAEQNQRLQTVSGALESALAQRQAIRDQQQGLTATIESARAALAENQLEIGRLGIMASGLTERLNALSQDSAIFDETQQAAVASLGKTQHILDDEDKKLLEIEADRVAMQREQRNLQDEMAKIEEDMYRDKGRMTEMSTKQAALIEQENQQEGFSYAVKQVLDWSVGDSSVLGCIKDLFSVEKQFEVAVETALGRNLQNLVVTHEDVVDSYIERLKTERAGRATFMPLKGLEPREIPKKDMRPGYFGCACHHIQCDDAVRPALHYILSNVFFAENLQHAKKAARDLPKGSRVVTLEGEVLNVGGTVTGGSLSKKETGFLKRKREIVELGEAIDGLTKSMAALEAKRQACQEGIAASRKAFTDSEAALSAQKNAVLVQRNALEQVRQSIAAATTSKGKLAVEQGSLTQQLDQIAEELARLKHRDISEKEAQEIAVSDLSGLTEALAAMERDHSSLSSELTDLRIADARMEEEIKGLALAKDERQAQLDATLRQSSRRASDLLTLEQTLVALGEEVVQKEALLKELRSTALQFEEALMSKRSVIEQLKTRMQGLSLQVENLRNQVASMNDAVFRLEIDKTKMETRRDNILQNLYDKYELSYIEAINFKHDFDLKEYSSEAKKLKAAIKALGEVNLGAIKEYETVSERYTFLCEQKADLNEAKAQLSKLIREMDKEMRQSFKDKMEEINGYFKETFASLFGGGLGDIVCEGSEDILEAEIVIHAQPPGKKLQSLDLMSGGEKALTAIALLFAILRTKPSPFCILDEIEAALDDVNIFRFATFLQEFVKQSQFIIITHRKGTMEIAQSLYGVTMQEQGISTVISVKLDDAKESLLEVK